MKILITNSSIAALGGAQAHVRDLVGDLIELGHEAALFTLEPGDAKALAIRALPAVVTNVHDLPFKPDVIHGQHHLSMMTALFALPDVPAIHHCHGAVWREWPPKHPRILSYVTIADTLAERLAMEGNLDPGRIHVLPNTYNARRFTTVRQPPDRLRRALFYNKIHGPDSPTLKAVAAATQRLGISLEFAGRHFDRIIPEPERILPEYDLVFASGKSAIDALACGCAVVVLGRTSCGGLVMPDTYEGFRRVNFSIAVNSPSPNAESIEQSLRGYTPEGCAEVCRRLRGDSDSMTAARQLLRIYEEAIGEHRAQPRDPLAEMRAAAAYFRRLTPLFRHCEEHHLSGLG